MSDIENVSVKEVIIDGEPAKGCFFKDKEIFTVSNDFTESQVLQAYTIANQFYVEGVRSGIGRIQNDIRFVLGLKDTSTEN